MTSKRDGGGSSQPVSTATGQPTGTISSPTKAPRRSTGTGGHTVEVHGVALTIRSDGRIQFPDGKVLPSGSILDGRTGTIQIANSSDIYSIHDGQIFVAKESRSAGASTGVTSGSNYTPISIHGRQYVETPYGGSPATPAQSGSLAASDNALAHTGGVTPPAMPTTASRSRTQPPSAPATGSGAVYDAISRAARENGVPLALALAIAQHESGFDAGNTTGDNGDSWGLYQLNARGGEGAGMGNSRLDPYINASTALKVVGAVLKANPNADWGWVAAHAQRPADPAGYANTINGIVSRARNDPNYFASQLKGAHVTPDSGGFGPAIPATGGGGGRIPGASAPVGTGPGGAMTSGDPTPALPPNATPQQIQTYVEQYYPDIVPYLHDKEIGPILLQAAQGGWSDARLQGAVQKTDFWKTHSQSQRTWDLLNTTDRATAHSKVQQEMASVQQLLQTSGQQLSPLQIHDISVNALRNGWTSDQIKAAIGAQSKIAVGPNGAPTGQAAVTLDSLRQQASQYLVPVSAQTLQTWVNQISNGQVPAAAFDSYLKEQAKSLFPGMSVAIDSGVTPTQYTDPYKQIAAQTLQVPPDSVNFSDPKWSKALFQVDPKTGARTSMSLADWGKTLRSDPIYGYGKTAGAKTQAADFAEQILQTFGAIGNYGGNG